MKSEHTERIDKLLVERGLAESRTKAQAMVMAGIVLVNEQRVEKSSEVIPANAEIRIKGGDDPASRYVGRGGLKLEAALSHLDSAGIRLLFDLRQRDVPLPRPAGPQPWTPPDRCRSSARRA